MEIIQKIYLIFFFLPFSNIYQQTTSHRDIKSVLQTHVETAKPAFIANANEWAFCLFIYNLINKGRRRQQKNYLK